MSHILNCKVWCYNKYTGRPMAYFTPRYVAFACMSYGKLLCRHNVLFVLNGRMCVVITTFEAGFIKFTKTVKYDITSIYIFYHEKSCHRHIRATKIIKFVISEHIFMIQIMFGTRNEIS